jgi:hypothetical protein
LRSQRGETLTPAQEDAADAWAMESLGPEVNARLDASVSAMVTDLRRILAAEQAVGLSPGEPETPDLPPMQDGAPEETMILVKHRK